MKNSLKILITNILVCVTLLAAYVMKAQNLIPNPSFEILKACPTGSGQLDLAEPWEAILTPDLFNVCSESVTYGVPQNQTCNYLLPQEGDGYTGMFVYNSHEFIRVTLTDTLETGRRYYVRFFVAAEDNCGATNIPYATTDAIGLAVKGTGPIDNFRVVAQNRGTVISDALKWTKVSGCFVAEGNELIVQIGNFLDDDSTLIATNMPQVPNTQQFNYMFVDDVLLTPFDPFPDTLLLCDGQPLNLNASFYDANLQWLTGETSPVLLALDTGNFVVTATIDGCVMREEVTVVNFSYKDLMPPDTSICKGDEIRLSPGIPGRYRWQNGDEAKTITISKPDTYKAVVSNMCGDFNFEQKLTNEDCRCSVFVPNIFTPNGDGINDLLEIGLGCDYEYIPKQFRIFNRWGGLAFSADNFLAIKWDGNQQGKPAQNGEFTWYLSYELIYDGRSRLIIEDGSVTVVY